VEISAGRPVIRGKVDLGGGGTVNELGLPATCFIVGTGARGMATGKIGRPRVKDELSAGRSPSCLALPLSRDPPVSGTSCSGALFVEAEPEPQTQPNTRFMVLGGTAVACPKVRRCGVAAGAASFVRFLGDSGVTALSVEVGLLATRRSSA
jgi:hypothetical protein